MSQVALDINQSLEIQLAKASTLDPGGIPERRALGMRGVFTSILARGQAELPEILHCHVI
jgi:hypothetical protein